MTGVVTASTSSREAGFSSRNSNPSRFDRFLAVSSSAGVAASCSNGKDFYNAITNSGLRFTDPASPGADFGLYSPTGYEPGSSVYHNDPKRLTSDCDKLGIARSECSDLMTQELLNGYTQRSVGEPVRRMMASLLGASKGQGVGSCAVGAGSGKSDSSGTSGASATGGMPKINLPIWAWSAIGGVGLIGILLLIFAVCTSCSRKSG
jgi:hypothetical protein